MNRTLHNAILFIIPLLICLCRPVENGPTTTGTTYYLSPEGDNSASGTSEESAWRSIDKVNATTFGPGDRILFEGGETFNGSLNFDRADSGTPDNPVTVGSYGTGRATISSGSENGFYGKNTSGFVVRDLIFAGAGATVDADFSGVVFYTDLDTVKPEFIRIDNLKVSGYRWDGIGVHGYKKEGGSGFRDVRITNCRVHDNGDKGITSSGPMPPEDWGTKAFMLVTARCTTSGV